MVVYSDGSETLVCEYEGEQEMLKEYFTEGGRNLDEYDRTMVEGVVEIVNNVKVSGSRIVA